MQPPSHAFPSAVDTPEKSGPNWLKIFGIGCGVLFALAALCGAGIFMCVQSATASKDDAHAFLGELRAGNTAAAHARMSPTYQLAHDATAFQQSVAAMPALTTHVDATFTNFNVRNGTHYLDGTLATPTGPVVINMVLMKAGGGFQVYGLTVGGQPFPGL